MNPPRKDEGTKCSVAKKRPANEKAENASCIGPFAFSGFGRTVFQSKFFDVVLFRTDQFILKSLQFDTILATDFFVEMHIFARTARAFRLFDTGPHHFFGLPQHSDDEDLYKNPALLESCLL